MKEKLRSYIFRDIFYVKQTTVAGSIIFVVFGTSDCVVKNKKKISQLKQIYILVFRAKTSFCRFLLIKFF